MYYFLYYEFSYSEWTFFSGFLYLKKKTLPDIFFQNVLFSILNFYFQNKSYIWNFLNCVGCGLKNVGCRKNLPQFFYKLDQLFLAQTKCNGVVLFLPASP